MSKRMISFLMAALLLLSLCACQGSEAAKPEADILSVLCPEYFGLRFAGGEEWYIADEEEMNEVRGFAVAELSEDELREWLAPGAGIPVFQASGELGTASVAVQSVGELDTERAVMEATCENIAASFAVYGIACETAEVIEVELAGQTHTGMKLHVSIGGVDSYELIVAVKKGDHFALVAGTSHPEDNTSEILEAFVSE